MLSICAQAVQYSDRQNNQNIIFILSGVVKMAVCYYCKERKNGFTQFPSKYVGKKICSDCCEKLGLNYLLTTEESLKIIALSIF